MIFDFLKKVLPYIVLISTPFAVLIYRECQHKKELQEAYEKAAAAYVTLDDDCYTMVYDTIRDTIEVSKGVVREISKETYKDYADKSLIKDIGIKTKDVVQQHNQQVIVHDTVYLVPEVSLNDSTISFTYSDKWASFNVDMKDTTLTYSIRDSLTTYISKKYKHKFLWFRWGKNGYDVNVVNHNPNSHIDKNTVIFVK